MADAYTPEWWLARLLTQLGGRQARYELLDRYHRSDAPLPLGPSKQKPMQQSESSFQAVKIDPFEILRKIARVNWADIIVEALVERMQVLGFSTGGAGDTNSDLAAWKIWQANDLDTSLPQLLRTKAALSEAYAIVGGIDPRIGVPRITFEDPRQMIVEADPTDRTHVLAALKVFADDVEMVDRAYLYLPGEADGKAVLHRAVRDRTKDAAAMTYGAEGWRWDDGELLATATVPVVWFPNRADLYGRTMGEFEHVIDDLNRISMLVLQRCQIAMLQAFRQRALKGNLDPEDEYGKPINYDELFTSDPAAFWLLPSGVDVWESSGVDLTPILESVKGDVRELAGRTRTPLYYLYPNEGGSAEGAVTQREGLIFRTGSRTTETDGPLEHTIALALEVMGEEAPPDMETVWRSPDFATLSERFDAAAKALAAGLPHRWVWRTILQYSPQEIARIEADRAAAPATAGV